MPILDLQKRARELGRIRIGQVVETGNGKTRPGKIDRFRLTSASKPLLDRVAELYGGTVTEWQPQGGGSKAWEVLTDARRIPILVPPNPVSQWMEYWTGGGCRRRCDGQTELLSDSPCICKVNIDSGDNDELLCKPTTRLNVVLRDVEGVGVWRLETHGWNAAVELPDVAQFLAHLQADGYVDGFLALEERTSKADVNGKVVTRRFMVPTIEVDSTPAQLLAARHGGSGTAAVDGPVARPALEAGPGRDFVAEARAATTLDQWRDIFRECAVANGGQVPVEVKADLVRIGEALRDPVAPPEQSGSARARVDGADPEVLWQQILAAAGNLKMGMSEVENDFASKHQGLVPGSATAEQLAEYLADLRERAAA